MPLTGENFKIPLFIVNRPSYMRMYINMIVKTRTVNVKFLWRISRLPKRLKYVQML